MPPVSVSAFGGKADISPRLMSASDPKRTSLTGLARWSCYRECVDGPQPGGSSLSVRLLSLPSNANGVW